MDRLRSFRFAAASLAGLLAFTARAQTAPNPVLINPDSPAKRSAPRPSSPRVISPEVAAQLRAASPKYAPPPPKPAPKPEEEMVDAREVDKPRNGIIRLPKYIVQEPKAAVLTERAVNTDKGIKEIAMRRYITDMDRALNGFTLPLFGSSMESRAMAMYAEDERLKNISDMKDAASTVGKSDAAQGSYILKESQKTFMRTGDFGWQGGGPK